MSAEFRAAASSHPEQWELFELVTEGSTELNAHVKAHVTAGCPSCGKHLDDIRTLSRAREMKEEFDAFFDELPQDDAPATEREEFLLKFKKKNRPADRLGRLSHDGRQLAAEIVKAVSEEGLDKAKELLGKIEADPSRGYAYLYACQLAMPKVSTDPAMLRRVRAGDLGGHAQPPVPQGQGSGAARVPGAGAWGGGASRVERAELPGSRREARALRSRPRQSFVEAGEDSFALALVDFFEGSAARFEGDFAAAWRLLKSARSEFQLYGQENWQGRAEAALGLLLLGRGKSRIRASFL